MFRKVIDVPVYPLSNEYIETLQRPYNEPDLSLTMLALACFKNKIPSYDGIHGKVTTAPSLEGFYQDAVTTAAHDTSTVSFAYYRAERFSIENVDDTMLPNTFAHVTQVENFINSKFTNLEIKIWKSEVTNAVTVLINRLGLDLYHLIISFLPLYYPLIYTKPLTKEDPEVKVLSSLSKNTSDSFEANLSEMLKPYAEEFYRCQIKQLFVAGRKRKIEEADRLVNRMKTARDNAMEQYSRAVDRYREAIKSRELTASIESKAEWEDELIEYLCSNEKIRNVQIADSQLSFTVATTLTQFSTDAWDSFARNGSIFNGPYSGYTPVDAFAEKQNRKLLFNAIFSDDPKFEVKMCGHYYLNLYNHTFGTNGHFDYVEADPIYADYIPNPHLKNYECLGDYHPRVINALDRDDVITALELCVYSAGSVNLDETEQNFKPLLKWILQSDKKILRRFDGVDMTPSQALLWLIDNTEKENAE